MAKPKSRIESAAIAGMLGVSSSSVMPAPGVLPPEGVSARGEGAHPVRDQFESGVARADNALVLDPRRVVRRGRYVRPFTDDHHFQELLAAIEEAGRTIHVPILVRLEGVPGAVEYVLVDGTHRLEAALRLGISLPAVNLGRISTDRALAIQAMANEVRASMHVVDQVSYVLTLLAQGLTREAVQRTTGFSAGRVSELVGIGMLLAGLSELERDRARRAPHITHRSLRAIKAAATDANAFRRGVMALVTASEAAAAAGQQLEADGDEIDVTATVLGVVPSPSLEGGKTSLAEDQLGSNSYQLADRGSPGQGRRGRTAVTPGGVTFVAARNARGTSSTYRVAWRVSAVRGDPEVFLERVRELLQAIAANATADYQAALARRPAKGRRRGGGVAAATEAWRAAIAREEAELAGRAADPRGVVRRADAIPEEHNPIPVPPSQRRPGDAGPPISPRLLAGLSIPMLADRLKAREEKKRDVKGE